MIELVSDLAAAGLVGWLVRKRMQQREEAARQLESVRITCLVRQPADGGRWTRGRMVVGPATMQWEPSARRRVPGLPDGLVQTGERSPSWREAILLNGGARIIECNSAEGEVQMAVMPGDLPHLLAGLELLRSDRMLLMRPGDRLPATGYSAATR